MASQLSKKAALPLAKILATCRNNVSNSGPWSFLYWFDVEKTILRLSFYANRNSHIDRVDLYPESTTELTCARLWVNVIYYMEGHIYITEVTLLPFSLGLHVNLSPPWQNGPHFADDIFKCIILNEKFCILIRISLKFVPMGPIDNKSALVQLNSLTPNKPLPETMLTQFTNSYISDTRRKWVNASLCMLTHWGRVTHICVGNLTTIGSDNGLSPGRRQAII